MESVKVRAIYNQDKKIFDMKIGNARLELDPIQFARIVEYLETVLSSYSEWKRKQK